MANDTQTISTKIWQVGTAANSQLTNLVVTGLAAWTAYEFVTAGQLLYSNAPATGIACAAMASAILTGVGYASYKDTVNNIQSVKAAFAPKP